MPEKFAFFAIDQNDSVQWTEMINSVSIPGMRADVMAANETNVVLGGSVASFDTIDLSPTVALNVNEQLYTTGWFAKYSLGGGVSLKEQNRIGLSLYPNPVTQNLTLANLPENFENIQLEIRDVSGRLFRTHTADASTTTIPVADLTPGVYILSVLQKGTGLENMRFIKK